MTVVAYVPDLMDRSRLGGIVDLGRPGVLEVVASITAPVLGFGSHVDSDLLEAARAGGCALVLPRSRFFADPAAAVASVRSPR